MDRMLIPAMLLISVAILFTGCSKETENLLDEGSSTPSNESSKEKREEKRLDNYQDREAVTDPNDIAVLVNKQFSLPENYEPSHLVYPNIPFIFNEKVEKRKIRREAAEAIERLFDAARKDGVYLAGVSAYRSHATQKQIFNSFVQKDGEEKARIYSAVPGTSEHETGLAIDISGIEGKCAALDCFAGSKEAKWLAKHTGDFGFIVRYPKGKESITGYQYEPWHMRYVGPKISRYIVEKDIALEEYYNVTTASK